MNEPVKRSLLVSNGWIQAIVIVVLCGFLILGVGWVEDWRHTPQVQPIRCSPFPLGVPRQTVSWFPAPATSNPSCRFPAMGLPARFRPRVM